MARSALYVIQVTAGKEERVKRLILRLLPDTVEDCYTPAYEVMRRVRGEWKIVRGTLLPGYVFVQTSNPERMVHGLREVPAFTRLLGNSDESFTHLTAEEVSWLNAFTNIKTHVVEMSEGVIEGDQVVVTKGPLMGREAQIARIDRHRRLAELDVYLFGRTKRVKVGLEIVRKHG